MATRSKKAETIPAGVDTPIVAYKVLWYALRDGKPVEVAR